MSKLGYHVRDVHDHLLRIADTVDTYRDLLSSGIDLYMSSVSNRLNRVVNRLTVVTVVVGVLAVITGFYGMPQRIDDRVKPMTATISSRLRPRSCDSHPVSGRMMALAAR